jgi:hypothetical protein
MHDHTHITLYSFANWREQLTLASLSSVHAMMHTGTESFLGALKSVHASACATTLLAGIGRAAAILCDKRQCCI